VPAPQATVRRPLLSPGISVTRPTVQLGFVRRHLTENEAVSALRRGRAVEQLLDEARHEGRSTVRWLSIFRREDAFVVLVHHVYDDGSPAFRDLSEFEPVDIEEDVGEGTQVAREPEPETALMAASSHGAVPERWVNEGVVADEYARSHGYN
jgi:hypothetical protein